MQNLLYLCSDFRKLIIMHMEAALRQSVMQYGGTISEEKWDSLHTVDELDASLKRIIHNHFHG